MGYLVLSVILLMLLVGGTVVARRAARINERMLKVSIPLSKAFCRIVGWPYEDFKKFREEQTKLHPWAIPLGIWMIRVQGGFIAFAGFAGLCIVIRTWVGAD